MQSGNGATEKNLEAVRRRLDRWRRSRSGTSGRIPNKLWKMAAEAAATCGAEATAARLKLDLGRLQDWMDAKDRQTEAVAQPTFVELPPFPLSGAAECTLEMEESSGRKLRIRLKGQATAQALALSQMLWRASS